MKHIYTIHHYLGTFFFGLFLIWFLSGFVMLYKSFPFLSEKERIENNEPMKQTGDYLPHPATVFTAYKNESSHLLRVNSILGKPVYHLITKDGAFISKFAHTRETVKINEHLAVQIARSFTGIKSNSKVTILDEVDQWIPRPKYAKHLPVYKVCFADAAGTFVHISSKTGEVLSNTSYSDRFWAWLGAIPHWIYLKEIRMYSNLWRQLIICLSSLGFIMSLSGIITGIVRYRKKPKAKFKRFKNKWYNIHYYTGLAFGLFVCTWIFSGFMSMTPFNWSSSSNLSEQESLLWEGGPKSLVHITNKEWENFQHSIRPDVTKEIHFSTFSGKLFSTLFTNKATTAICLSRLNYNVSENDLSAQLNCINSTDSVVNIELLEQYDNYYYDRTQNKILPIFKIITNRQRVYYIDPSNGKVLQKSDGSNRLERWLYHGLHSLDFSFLTKNRPLWDIIMIILLMGGTAVSFTGVGLGIKFIKRKSRKHFKRKAEKVRR